ncbi:class I SAM-dependent methyltransferase [Legionella drozanskii]|uniref:Methyltransferase domain protein n=1 Tax=Legionella drozanskii LLAP-1 TaxID=1212489 RepID=A0A0W0TDY3_9GAMM|nr:class I SAM-dependent methyltransferase [Legionella drozanskii]KTC93820.1 Methyltransferase domain protein [Legionella drozanskii LLAP-1]
MKDYIRHFSQQSENYLLFRPNYPTVLYDYLSNLVQEHQNAWDCGTGNGQAALALTQYFTLITATDINQAQLDQAPRNEKIRYICCTAENTPILPHSIDLITVAQALHWFNFDLFYEEVRRVSKPAGIIAVWCYSLGKFDTGLDDLVTKLYTDILGDEYWPMERRYIDEEYRTIPFPFSKISSPSFTIDKKLNLAQFLGYLNTWSAVKEYQLRNKLNPINWILKELEAIWGDPKQYHPLQWPIHLLVGSV